MSEAAVGMLIVDKPAGATSHDVVARVRRILGCKAGHTGTLDPQATGVLLVCLGGTTRLTRFLQHQDKLYDCGIRFGWATDTYDADGKVVGEVVEVPALDEATVQDAVKEFVGRIVQVPPVYSAKKIRGQPAYKRARRGEQVEHRPIDVEVHRIDVLEVSGDRVDLRVECGAGTYVRTLAHDLGSRLGCPAHLESLRRLRVGGFPIERAVDWETVAAADAESLLEHVLPAADMFPEWPAVRLNEAGTRILDNGGVLEPRHVVRGNGGELIGRGTWVRVLAPNGGMVAAAEGLLGGMIQPRVVLR